MYVLLGPLTIRIRSGFRSSRGRAARLTFSRLHFKFIRKKALHSAAVGGDLIGSGTRLTADSYDADYSR